MDLCDVIALLFSTLCLSLPASTLAADSVLASRVHILRYNTGYRHVIQPRSHQGDYVRVPSEIKFNWTPSRLRRAKPLSRTTVTIPSAVSELPVALLTAPIKLSGKSSHIAPEKVVLSEYFKLGALCFLTRKWIPPQEIVRVSEGH